MLEKLTNQSGMSFYWEYAGKGDNACCIHTWGDGGVLEYRFEYGEGMTRVVNSLGHTEEYYYDKNKLIYKIIDGNGGITNQTYNEHQELIATVNPEGHTVKSMFNEYGKLIQRIDENGGSTRYTYDEMLNLTAVYTPGGASRYWEYDELNRVTARTNAAGETFTYSYEGKLLKTVRDSRGNSVELEYSNRNDLLKLTYSNGLFRNWEYDELGRLTASADVNGNRTRYRYDRMDNLIEMEEPDGNVHHFEYSASGEMLNAKDSLHEVSFEYGPMGVLKSRRQNSRRVRFGYDSELQLRNIVNEGGEEYSFGLDALGRVVGEKGFDGLEREYIRDGAGRVTKVLRPDDRWTSYTYDDAGNVLREEHHDDTESAYAYNADGLLMKASNEEGIIEFSRDRAGRIVSESFGGNSIKREYDKNGNCLRLTSSLGADIRFDHDAEGNLMGMQAGQDWQASWRRDRAGLELQRQLTGGVNVRTERDRFGRERRRSVTVRNAEQNAIRYNWGTGNRLLGIQEEWTGKQTTFNYDAFDNLTKAEYSERNAVSAVYRIPDVIGNLFETPYRNDRKYDRGGRLTEDANHFYHYDCEGNLVFKEFKKPQGYSSLGKAALQKKYGIKFKATATGWLYEWSAGGMLERVVNPQQGKVTFGYDALGRRVYKEVKHTRTNWLWDGNVPLHEWQTTEKEPLIDIVTWVFEEGAFVPAARITEHNSQSILTDYLGTPIEMYGANGEKTWKAQLDIYGRVRTFVGSSLSDCPFRYQGQYQDSETGLYYNRFRYYDPDTGNYLSQDPIRLNGGIQLYGYVKDTNAWLDVLGLAANRGRIQAQGTHLEKSVSWDKTTPLTVSEGLSMVDELESKLSKSERKLRQSELEKVRNFIKNAGEAGGVDAPVSKTFQVKGTKHERIDIEVNSGTAFVPDENTKIKGYH